MRWAGLEGKVFDVTAQSHRHTDAVVRATLILGLVVVLLLGLVWAFQRSLIYLPSRAPVPPAAAVLDGARDVVLQTSDGLRLGAWYVRAKQPELGVAVLVANGNAGNRAARAPLARALAERGLAVLLFDYRGYGGNPGSPSERGLAHDVRAARRFLAEQPAPRDHLLYYGESLGAAVVTELATEQPPAGLVLRSPFVDLASVGRVHYPYLPVRTLLKDRYPLAEQVATLRLPITIVYGTKDSIVPPAHSRTVAESALGSTQLIAVQGADHNDPALLDGDVLINAIVRLAEQVRRPPPPPPP
jgi:fermentation-respiration switch protein FrsA (DUF1100 family)